MTIILDPRTTGAPATAVPPVAPAPSGAPEAPDWLLRHARLPLTRRVPWLLPVAVRIHRARRRLLWWTAPLRGVRFARRPDAAARAALADPEARRAAFGVRVARHGSLLRRDLDPAEMVWQENKVVNLGLAGARLDGVVIRPGETFSFNRLVGEATRRRGYLPGMRLSQGRAIVGVGGGLCQLANLVHWMVLHSPLTVVERSEHSFDTFPDRGRVLPWGVGVSIVYNYVDLVVRNDTEHTFHLTVGIDEPHLRGELRSDSPLPHSYRVHARHEEFLRYEGSVYRRNEIWRTVIDRVTGDVVGEELLKRNCARVVYEPDPARVRDVG
ncbi:VanW family protein [Nocardioides sp.]|uniref:VanW family protein n=1 Tax=Nocardioides sp. TaxID=35761 RepID=UPI00351808F4